MTHKACPRTGCTVTGKSNRPHRHGPSRRIGSSTVISAPVYNAGMNPEELEKMADKIGQTIGQILAAVMANNQQTPIVIQQEVSANSPVMQARSQRRPASGEWVEAPNIAIDESIVDVGIGEGPGLKKGEGSATLAKAETKEDASLQKSKNRLQQLKRGRL